MEHQTWGYHLRLDLFECQREKITNKEILEKYLIDISDCINMKRFGDPQVHRFGNDILEGYSGFQFIAESNIAFHCNEQNGNNNVHIDIFSCKAFDIQKAIIFSINYFNAKEVNFDYKER